MWHPEHRSRARGGAVGWTRGNLPRADLVGLFDVADPDAGVFASYAEHGGNGFATDSEQRIPVLFGVVPGAEITMINVLCSDGHAASHGYTRQTVQADVLVRGAQLEQGLDTKVTSLTVAFDALGDWYDTRNIGRDEIPFMRRDGQEQVKVTIDWVEPPTEEAVLASGIRIQVGARTEHVDSFRELSYKATPEIAIMFPSPTRLEDALEMVTPLRWLTSLITRSPARITRLRAVEPDERDGFDIFFAATEPTSEYRKVHPWAVAVGFTDFDIPNRLPHWLNLTERLRVPMALMFGNWFASGLYGENRLLSAASAAESLASLVFPTFRTPLSKRREAVATFVAAFPHEEHELLRARLHHINDPAFADILGRLIAETAAGFALVIGDANGWVTRIVKARNDIAHGNRLHDDGAFLLTLSESLEYLIEMHLLLQLGMTADEVANTMERRPRTKWLAQLAHEHLDLEPRGTALDRTAWKPGVSFRKPTTSSDE